MGRNNLNWVLTIILVLVLIVLLPQVLSYGRGHMGYEGYGHPMHSGYGMMGHGVIGFWWVIPAIIMILVIALGVWFGNLLSVQRYQGRGDQNDHCPNCAKPLQADWKTCPYCGKDL